MEQDKLKFTTLELCNRFNINLDNTNLKKAINWNNWENSTYLLKNKDEIDFVKNSCMFGCDYDNTMSSVFNNTILPRLGLKKMYDSFLQVYGDSIDWTFFSKYSEWSIDLLEKYKDKYIWKYCTFEFDDIKHIFDKYPYLLTNSPWYITKYELYKKLNISYAGNNLLLKVIDHQDTMIITVETTNFILDENIHYFVVKYENEEIKQMTRNLKDISFASETDKKLYLNFINFKFIIDADEGRLSFHIQLVPI